jgi:hypothetical protein
LKNYGGAEGGAGKVRNVEQEGREGREGLNNFFPTFPAFLFKSGARNCTPENMTFALVVTEKIEVLGSDLIEDFGP